MYFYKLTDFLNLKSNYNHSCQISIFARSKLDLEYKVAENYHPAGRSTVFKAQFSQLGASCASSSAAAAL